MEPQLRMLASDVSHMAFLFVWQRSGVTQKRGFELHLDMAYVRHAGYPFVALKDRGKKLLAGEYQFLSGLHHEPYIYRARGDKRFVYLAQAQNDWDDRLVVAPGITSAAQLEGQKVMVVTSAPCVLGNLKHSLALAGARPERIQFEELANEEALGPTLALEAVGRKQAAAANVDIPFDRRAEKLGLQRLALPSVPVIHNVTICANRDWVLRNEDTVDDYLRSMIEAIHFFKTQPQRVCEILEQDLAPIIRLEGADEIEHLQRIWAGLLSSKPYPHPLAVWNVYNLDIAHHAEINFIEPFECWDTSYLRNIDDSGFIDALYGGAEAARNPAVRSASVSAATQATTARDSAHHPDRVEVH